MAEDLELEKGSPDGEEREDTAKKSKNADKAKVSKDKDGKTKDSKNAKTGKKRRGPIKYLKDARSEFKKVVWPTPKETTHNTVVVVVVCILAGALVFGVDSLFGLFNNLLFK